MGLGEPSCCWRFEVLAEDSFSNTPAASAKPPSSVQGVGPNRGHGQGLHVVYQIIRSCLAQYLSETLFATFSEEDGFNTHSVLEHVITERLIKNCGTSDPQAGIILLTKEHDNKSPEGYTVRLWCAFTTASMAIAYASTYDLKPKALVLRRPRGSRSSLFVTSLPLSRT